MSISQAHVQDWLDRYVAAWKSYDPQEIAGLFAEEADYRYHPWDDPVHGRDAIVADWLENPDKPETWDAHYTPYAVDGDRAVAIGESRYTKEDGSFRALYYNVWTLRFDGEGRCVDYVEYFMELPEPLRPTT
jgi:hypothetical protein